VSSVFTRIIAGELPGHFVWDDERCIGIMTIQPFREGHLLVIPREEIECWYDLPDELAGHLMVVAGRLAKAIKQAFSAQRVGLVIAGMEVPHVHLHVMPIDGAEHFNFRGLPFADPAALATAAGKIRRAL